MNPAYAGRGDCVRQRACETQETMVGILLCWHFSLAERTSADPQGDQNYKDVCNNKGFRVIDNYMITYNQEKKGMSYYYYKRIICANGIDTLPLPI
jgi:hypothetical protein